MGQQATVLVLAELDDDVRASVDGACTSAGFSPTLEPSAEVATTKLGARRYDALVVHLGTPGAALACMKARGRLLRSRVPVLALVDDEDDATFARAYRAGPDEVLPVSRPDLLAERLAALPKGTVTQPAAHRGDAVVADADRNRAEVLERVLKDAGFRVEVALDGFATRLQAGRPSIKVAVVDASLDEVGALISQARSKGSRCAWVVRVRPELLDELRAKLSSFDRVAVVSAYGPPDDVLFETNRLLEARPADGRADPRLLHGTIVGIEWSGEELSDIGYTYNVSALGLYVRTLAKPRSGDVVLRLLPPGGGARLRLEGKVVWRREFGPTHKEPVPAGFGVRIVGGDIDAWSEAAPKVVSMRPQMMSEAELPPPQPQMRLKRPPPGSRLTPPPGAVRAVVMAPSPAPGKTAPSPALVEAAPAATVAAPAPATAGSTVTAAAAASAPRGRLSSVEQMLASILDGGGAESEGGATPLSIDGDAVVALAEAGESAAAPAALASDDETITVESLGFDADESTRARPNEPPPRRAQEDEQSDARIEDGPTRSDTPVARAAKQAAEKGGPPSAFARTVMAEVSPVALPSTDASLPSERPSDRATMPGDLSLVASAEVPAAPPAVQVAAGAPAGLPSPATAVAVEPPPRDADGGHPEVVAGLPRRGVPLWVSLGAGGVVVGAVLAFALGAQKPAAAPVASVKRPARPEPAVAAPVAAPPAVPEPTAAAPVAAALALAASAAGAGSAAAPGESASAPPPAAAAPAELDAPDPAALAALPHGHGLLVVASSLSTNVYVYGHLAGTTNQPITSKCGPRFLRLGTAPGAWQGEGAVHVVKCGGFTRVEMRGE